MKDALVQTIEKDAKAMIPGSPFINCRTAEDIGSEIHFAAICPEIKPERSSVSAPLLVLRRLSFVCESTGLADPGFTEQD